jgi:hypothetical protein
VVTVLLEDRTFQEVSTRMEVRKREKEFIALLTQLDGEIASSIRCIYLVLDSSSVHKGKQARAWFQAHPRFVCWFLSAAKVMARCHAQPLLAPVA